MARLDEATFWLRSAAAVALALGSTTAWSGANLNWGWSVFTLAPLALTGAVSTAGLLVVAGWRRDPWSGAAALGATVLFLVGAWLGVAGARGC